MLSFIIILVIYLVILSAAYAAWSAAPWVPTFKNDVDRILKLAVIQPGQKIYDLGCGDGRILFSAAKQGAIAEGFEISLLPYCISLIRSRFQKIGRIKVSLRDFWLQDLSDADIVYCFLMPKVCAKLKLKFEKELKNGAKVITHSWPINGWDPVEINTSEGRATLYLYRISRNNIIQGK